MPLESRVDVLVIGAGPAGLMCANALALAHVDVRIIDKRPVRVTTGQADGITQRTAEVLQSYGLAERLIREGNQVNMGAFYNPAPNGGIEFTKRFPIVAVQNARYKFSVTLHQGAIEALFLDSMKECGVEVERPICPVNIEISEDAKELSNPSSHPVKVTLEHLDATDEESKTEIVHAKFVVGADGAHSWVRKALGIEMKGEQTNSVWGVLDIRSKTNLPDIRNFVFIHSPNGSCTVVPRERDLFRLYVELLDTDAVFPSTGRVDKGSMTVTPEKLISVARNIFHPFELGDPEEVAWWTIYTIGQRVASSYSVNDRVFIAGDACHTHSPSAGQGMNASLNDTHNLAWKLVQVLRGWSSMSLLKTYEYERRKYAQDLIDFDREFAAVFYEKPGTENHDGIFDEKTMQGFQTAAEFISGVGVHYSTSVITDPKYQGCAENLVIGRRMPPHTFVRAADIRPVEIQDLLPPDIRFKILFFVGYLTEARVAELELLAEELSKPSSFLRKYSPDESISTVFDIIPIVAGKKADANYLLVPAFFRPHWSKVLLDDADAAGRENGHAYETFGIDPKQITLVVVRPDGYVGTVTPLTAVTDLDAYFGSFLVAPMTLSSDDTADWYVQPVAE